MSYRPRIGGGGKREWRPTLPKPRKKPLASPFCHQRARLSFQRLSETCRQESNTFKNPNESGGEGGIRTRGKRQKKGLFLRISKILCAMRCKENRSCAWEIVGKQSPRINPVAMNLRILLPILITWGCLAQPSTNSATWPILTTVSWADAATAHIATTAPTITLSLTCMQKPPGEYVGTTRDCG